MIENVCMRMLFLILISVSISGFSQDKVGLMKLKEFEFNSFPDRFEITQKVFEYYYEIGIAGKKIDILNDAQKTICFHFICDGLIDNSGFYSILLETNGEFNEGYLKALERIGDTTSKHIFDEIVSVFVKYKSWFLKQTNPPVLNETSKEFDEKLYNRIEELQKKWYANGKNRENLFKRYFKENKLNLIAKDK